MMGNPWVSKISKIEVAQMREFLETWLDFFNGVRQGIVITKICPIYIRFCMCVLEPLFLFSLPCLDPYVFR